MSSENAGTKGLADRYASALYDLADETRQLDAIANDLRALSSALAESADLRRFISSPVLSRDEQKRAITVLATKIGLAPTTQNFLGLLAANRRLFALPSMIGAFLGKLAAARGEVAAEVVSARELSKDQTSALASALKKAVGKDVAIEARIDPSLLGGLVVKIGSRMVDGSLRTKLQRLQLAMKGIG